MLPAGNGSASPTSRPLATIGVGHSANNRSRRRTSARNRCFSGPRRKTPARDHQELHLALNQILARRAYPAASPDSSPDPPAPPPRSDPIARSARCGSAPPESPYRSASDPRRIDRRAAIVLLTSAAPSRSARRSPFAVVASPIGSPWKNVAAMPRHRARVKLLDDIAQLRRFRSELLIVNAAMRASVLPSKPCSSASASTLSMLRRDRNRKRSRSLASCSAKLHGTSAKSRPGADRSNRRNVRCARPCGPSWSGTDCTSAFPCDTRCAVPA